MITAAADGSSLANPGPAGWAWYIDDERWAAGGWVHGTNNMAELQAVLELLLATAGADEELLILCDSRYVINSLTTWLPGWKRKGWRKGDGKPVLNVELMQQLDAALTGRRVRFEWVKGHSGHDLNDAADQRARAAATAHRDGTVVDAGPGFGIPRAEPRQPVAVVEPQPDLFSVVEEPPVTTPAGIPGTAGQRVKAMLVSLTRQLLSPEVRTDAERLRDLLHPDFIAHAVDGRIIDIDHGSWHPLDDVDLEVLGVDEYAPGVAGMRWRQRDRLRYGLWQQTPLGWRLRFAQVTPVPEPG
ncbi:MAG: DUF4440 domain-containing protein [Arachnia propionica]|uniref:RNase H family protein n=1 Tax=Arachnia propionica TaxID=1750 RepID=UPI0027084F70|nr:DUF4440 domain-containing protein [Arachnia propionica]